MKIKKIKLSTILSDIYGKDGYQDKIVEGKRFWFWWRNNSIIGEKYGQGWYEIEITYVRAGCMFYIFVKDPNIPEQFCPIDCFLASKLTLSELDPIADLPSEIKYSKLTVYFDDEHTIVKNWDNRPEIEITDEEFEKLTPQEQIFITLRI